MQLLENHLTTYASLLLFFGIFPIILAQDAISPKLRASLSQKSSVNVIVTFKTRTQETLDQVTLKTRDLKDRGEMLTQISDALESLAATSQKGALELLATERSGLKYHSLWITNQLALRGAPPALVNKLAALPDVLKIDESRTLNFNPFPPVANATERNGSNPTTIKATVDYRDADEEILKNIPSWGVARIKAPQVWKIGYTGKGIVVGTIDSGVRGTHDCLMENYVGTNNYGWFYPFTHTQYPDDLDEKHGTLCLGVAVGSDGYGVAPGAKWMACKVTDAEGWWDDRALACFQFMMCPTDYKGENKNCSRAPHVINNSWGEPPDETQWEFMWLDAIKALRTTDIKSVFSIGNYGRACNTTVAPGNYELCIGVGATLEWEDAVTRFSSAGPSYTNKNIIKPDLVAPGNQIRSTCADSDLCFQYTWGTSLSTPMVTGVIALMLQKNPRMSHDLVKEILLKSCNNALSRETDCGNKPVEEFPNNRAGWGIIDALKAINNVPDFVD